MFAAIADVLRAIGGAIATVVTLPSEPWPASSAGPLTAHTAGTEDSDGARDYAGVCTVSW